MSSSTGRQLPGWVWLVGVGLAAGVLAAVLLLAMPRTSDPPVSVQLEGHDGQWRGSLSHERGLSSSAARVQPRVMLEYANTVSQAQMMGSTALISVTAAVGARPLIEYGAGTAALGLAALSQLGAPAALVGMRVLIEYGAATAAWEAEGSPGLVEASRIIAARIMAEHAATAAAFHGLARSDDLAAVSAGVAHRVLVEGAPTSELYAIAETPRLPTR